MHRVLARMEGKARLRNRDGSLWQDVRLWCRVRKQVILGGDGVLGGGQVGSSWPCRCSLVRRDGWQKLKCREVSSATDVDNDDGEDSSQMCVQWWILWMSGWMDVDGT